VGLDDPERHLGLLQRGEADQAQDARVGDLPDDGHFSEVLVEGDEDSGLGQSASEDLLVARVGGPIARPDHVVSGRPEPSDGAAPDARVEEESHAPVGTRKGSTRSWATSRLA
jgi:hypothetical protein